MEKSQSSLDPSSDEASADGGDVLMDTGKKAEEIVLEAHDSAEISTSTRTGPTPLASQRSSASLSQSARNEITVDSTETDGTSSSDSIDVISGVSSDEELAKSGNGFTAGPRQFRSPMRPVRAHYGVPPVLLSSPPKAAADGLDLSAVPPDYPLPHHPFAFDILNHAPSRRPGPPPAWKHPRDMTSEERHEHHRREDERKKRERDQRQDFHSTAFFPYAHLPGLAHMEGVCAVVGGAEVRLMQVSTVSPSQTVVQEVTAPFRQPDCEEYFTCAWSVNISTHPYTPILAVAGRGRLVEVFLSGRQTDEEWILHHDRTITGHGGPIFDLTFHPSYPHVLASCSEDKTVRLWDVTVPWGTNAAVANRMTGVRGSGAERKERSRVEAELLAVLAEGGHEKAVLSCDFHAVQPLLVSSGADGFIKIWRLSPDVLAATPHWPSTPLYRPPTSPPPPSNPPVLGPPIFSSYAVHPGQWPDQVSFLSASSCTILSKAAISHPSSRFSPRTGIKIWVPTILDVLPDAKAEKRRTKVERSRGEASAADPRHVWRHVSERALLPVDARSSSGFRVAHEAVLEGQNCIGDKIGVYRRPSTSLTAGGPADVFFVAPTSTRFALVDGADGRQGAPALYFFRPFALPTSLASAKWLSHSQQSVNTAGVGAGRSDKESLDELLETLFPPDRDRLAHDFTPRLLPSAVVDIVMPAQQQSKAPQPQIHFRCTAIQPNGAGSIVGVGDGGLVAVWKRQRRFKQDGGARS
ncbi:polycomb protein EED [Rhodotorula toruloides]|uniref:Polycomb protein EED n=1 Tax=Rhodotorula toruloides TaxID=5286 RepID=A0A511K964_RHOTO|nr:polycomb protein EED [Rhodotorula toruloides]